MVGEPLLGMDQRPQMCNENARCPGQYFCHIGYDEYTTLCCPSVGDPCNLPLAVGRGSHRIVRWYYNALTRQCEQFYYTGLGGNDNNFLIREHCESTCPVWVNPCVGGNPLVLSNGQTKLCTPSDESTCPATYWCHPGLEPSTTVCCPGHSDPCTLPRAE
ncbi:unnamed protein product, partial [Anisakis simplex]|uniref:BPTI/Kunitz inhibitor domain-containing protein n=1 Tax=Anisakis simplex TaxID=6269 RepID=A0A0M3JFE8_ANISI